MSLPCLDPPKSKWHDGQRLKNVLGKIQPFKLCSEVAFVLRPAARRVNRIRLWPLRRDYHSGVLIGADGERRSDWSVRVLANDVGTRIDR